MRLAFFSPPAYMQVPWKIAVQLGLLHQTWLGQQLAKTSLLRWYFRSSSAKLGEKYDSPDSAKLIPRFIQVGGLPAPCKWCASSAPQRCASLPEGC